MNAECNMAKHDVQQLCVMGLRLQLERCHLQQACSMVFGGHIMTYDNGQDADMKPCNICIHTYMHTYTHTQFNIQAEMNSIYRIKASSLA